MRVVELFCGIGGMSLGFKRVGFHLVRGYDSWDAAIKVHDANLTGSLQALKKIPHRAGRRANLGRYDAEKMPDLGDVLTLAPEIAGFVPDIIVGGPPCQPFSSQGKRLGEKDPRAILTDAFAVIVATARPRYFVMENVPPLRKYRIYDRIKSILENVGYGLTETIVDASYYGVPQARKRLILAGCLGEGAGWLLPHLEAARAPVATTVADLLGPEFGSPHVRRDHVTATGRTSRWMPIAAGEVADPADEVVRLYWLTPGGPSSAGTRRADRPSQTITGGVHALPGPSYEPRAGDVPDVGQLPMPTFEQMLLIAGFPPTWRWAGVDSQDDRMQGLANAVPPPLAERIGRCILAHSRGERPAFALTVPRAFRGWLRKTKGMTPTRTSQIVSEYKTARRLLGASYYDDDIDAVLAALDLAPEYRSLGKSRRWNLRNSLRLYSECAEDLAAEADRARDRKTWAASAAYEELTGELGQLPDVDDLDDQTLESTET